MPESCYRISLIISFSPSSSQILPISLPIHTIIYSSFLSLPPPLSLSRFFLLGNYYLALVLSWSVVDTPSDSLLENTGFPFASRQTLQTASWLEEEPHAYSLLCHLSAQPHLAWISAGLEHDDTVCVSLPLGDTVSLESSIMSGS